VKEVNGSEPKHLTCPINLCVMDNPVMTTGGKTYERMSIQDWFDRMRDGWKIDKDRDRNGNAVNKYINPKKVACKTCKKNGIETFVSQNANETKGSAGCPECKQYNCFETEAAKTSSKPLNNTEPSTNKKLDSKELIPNRALRIAINIQ